MDGITLQELGAEVRKHRRQANLSQTELAKVVGLKNAASISLLESGKQPVSKHVIIKLKAALDLPSIYIEIPTTVDDVLRTLSQCEVIPGADRAALATLIKRYKQ